MSENEALQSDKLIKKIDEIQQNLENITLDFTDTKLIYSINLTTILQ